MPTRRQVVDAIACREAIAAKVRSYGTPGMEFDQCLQLCGTVLLNRYMAVNSVACLIEDAAISSGRCYRMKDGKLVWRTRALT